MAPFDETVDPVAQAKAIVAELKKIRARALVRQAARLVLNKMDMVESQDRERRVKDFVKRFKWKGPVFQISALTHEGCEPCRAPCSSMWAALKNAVPDDPDPRFDAAPVPPHAMSSVLQRARRIVVKAPAW